MLKACVNGNSKRSASAALASSDVQFPPAFLSDFVVHYRGVAYHVHKFVLCYHSSYFRTYIEPLIDGQRAYSTAECDEHPSITHCIRLPDCCGKVEAASDDFRLFVCHLYFAQHYSCIPYVVPADIDLLAQPPPNVTLDYPGFVHCDELDAVTASIVYSSDAPPQLYDAVMSLCHYFDCSVVLSRAEDNCLLVLRSRDDGAAGTECEWNEVWPCFVLALRCDLQRVKDDCMPRIAQHCKRGNSRRQEWQAARQHLDTDTAFDMLLAAFEAAK